MRRSIAATLIGLVASATACGSENASAGSENRAAHPCDIPKSALTDSGLNTEPLMTEPFGAEFAGGRGASGSPPRAGTTSLSTMARSH